MASIKKRGLYWRAQVRKTGYPAISRTFDSKAHAESWAKEIESQIGRGTYRPLGEAERTTLHEALDRYYHEIGSQKRHPAQELQRVRHWQRQILAKRYIATLRGTDFAKYRDNRRDAGKAENTIRLELQLVSHLYEIARKEWGMEGLQNPINNIRKPGGSVERDRRLRPGEFEALCDQLSQFGNSWIVPAFELAIETSLRQGMLLKLRRDWLAPSGQFFTIPPEFRSTGNKVVPPFVALSPRARVIVQELPRTIDGRLFGCTQNAIVMAWKKALKAARKKHIAESQARGNKPIQGFLEDLHWHDLRHEAASRLFEKGLHPMEVAAMTGHKNLTTLRRYTHLQPAQLLAKLG